MRGVGFCVVGKRWNSTRAGCSEQAGSSPENGCAAVLEAVRLEALEEARCWVGTVAHDFNNLLAAIGLNCDRIASEATNANEVRHLAARVRGLQQFARSQVEQLVIVARAGPHTVPVTRLSEVINEMLPLLEQLCGKKTRFHVRLDPRVGKVAVSPFGVRQVILNLVLNARDAVARDGRIGIEAFRCRAARGGGGARVGLRVWDNGRGMDRAARTGIERLFFSSKGGSMRGWGLFAVRRVVAEAGGELSIESRAGRGTRFTVFFPVIQSGRDGVSRQHVAIKNAVGRTQVRRAS
jgi:two-component system, cell cycle sensor histidine kinase and response regulator CckA